MADKLRDNVLVEVAGIHALDFAFDILPDDTRLVQDEGGRIPDATENDGCVSLPKENVCSIMLGGGVI
jgi:hypothetical protein